MEARKFHLEREMIVLKAPKLRRAAQNLCKRAEGHSRSLIKEKAHPSIRKKKLKGLRAAGQTSSIQKLHKNNTYKIKTKY
jgi:hypothetical protein